MKTAAILTSEESFINNYGAALQGYALSRTLEDRGYKSQIVRYQGAEFFPKPKPTLNNAVKKLLMPLHRYLHTSPADKERKAINRRYRQELAVREQYFARFQQVNMRFFNENRMNWFALKNNYPDTSIYVCGSDQIWNPYFKMGHNDPGYFLAFAPEGRKKIAYAPSFGCDDLPEPAQKDLGELLKSFQAISVREASGVDIVKKYARKEAQLVLDPTLLRTPEQWKAIARRPKSLPKHYILCYRFAESDTTKQMIDQLSEKLGLSVVSLPLANVAFHDSYQFVFEAGPQEFIGLIEHADLVCTDSFHATVFATLMKTPVCVFLREGFADKSSMNCRVYSFLQMLHLEELILTEKSTVDEALSSLKTDYAEAHQILEQGRQTSFAFLDKALQ